MSSATRPTHPLPKVTFVEVPDGDHLAKVLTDLLGAVAPKEATPAKPKPKKDMSKAHAAAAKARKVRRDRLAEAEAAVEQLNAENDALTRGLNEALRIIAELRDIVELVDEMTAP